MQYQRTQMDLFHGSFRVRGDTLEVLTAYDDRGVRVEFFGDDVDRISRFDVLTGDVLETVEQMARYCAEVPGHRTANLVEDGRTPWLTADELAELGYSVALYPVTLLLHTIKAMQEAVNALRADEASDGRVTFDGARDLVGWPDYDARLRAIADARLPKRRISNRRPNHGK